MQRHISKGNSQHVHLQIRHKGGRVPTDFISSITVPRHVKSAISKSKSFGHSQLLKTFPSDSVLRNWRLLLVLFLLSLFSWHQDREVTKKFYSVKEFDKWSKNNISPFPYSELQKKLKTKNYRYHNIFFNAYYWITFNYFSDIPLALEITARVKDGNEKVVRLRKYETVTRISRKDKNYLLLTLAQTPDQTHLQKLIQSSSEDHSYSTFCEFLECLEDAPTNLLEQSDWDMTKNHLIEEITQTYELKSGVKLYLIYKPKFSPFLLLNFLTDHF
jgi:hypothetical protein